MKLIDDEHEHSRVEMIPLMDVVFLLLVFFIYSFLSMRVQKGVDVALPTIDGSSVNRETIQIVMDSDDRLYLGEIELPENELVKRVIDEFTAKNLPVLIRADEKSHTGTALSLMQALKKNGINSVSYQVRKKLEQ